MISADAQFQAAGIASGNGHRKAATQLKCENSLTRLPAMAHAVYQPLKTVDDGEDRGYVNSNTLRASQRWLSWLAHAILLCLSALLLLMSRRGCDSQHCTQQVSAYCAYPFHCDLNSNKLRNTAPAIEAIEYMDITFNGTFHFPSRLQAQLDTDWESDIITSSSIAMFRSMSLSENV